MQTHRSKTRKGLKIGLALALIVPLTACAAALGLSALGYTFTANLTPSIAEGIYLLNHNNRTAERGRIVAFKPHNAAAQYGYEQGWMKPGSWYIKRVAAVAGDTVCVGSEATVATPSEPGKPATFTRIGPVADTDRTGKPLPHELKGCSRVPPGHFFPVGDGLPNSYDGRYYGFVPVSNIDGNLTAIWTRGPVKE
ncbi:signal peptidase I [Pseudoxanthomonas winnipegensis]|uniref:signal peptidase I n=1 Tax=Pseudoxanthomonas winnipegensis TaxID=2480810 RepID=UPI00102DC4D7|nr:signal peptidase I [Pseudoxanthomonas winnipegensis]TAA36404.1 signal peptidase I [Pseudoxanthomonas winnipegensis]